MNKTMNIEAEGHQKAKKITSWWKQIFFICEFFKTINTFTIITSLKSAGVTIRVYTKMQWNTSFDANEQ